jgi:MSHA biogenesis protein MshQ
MNNKILICLLMLISLLNRTRKSGVYSNFQLCLLSFKAHFGWKVKRSSVYVFCSALLSNNVCHTRLKNSGNSKPFRKILLLIGLLLVSGISSTLAATTTQDIFYDDFERTTRLTAIPAGNSVPDWNFVRLDNDFTSDISNHTAQSGTRSAYICCGERHLTTRDIDLSGVDNARLSYWFRYGHDDWSGTDNLGDTFDSEDPSGNDHIYAYIYRNNGSWQQIAFYEAELDYSGDIRTYSANLPASALHSQFKLRFYMSDGSGGSKHRDVYHIDDVRVTTEVSAGPDHFRLSYGSSALTCNPHTVTIQACEDASCSSLYTDSVDVTLSPTGWVGGDTVTFTGGSTSIDFSRTTASTVTLGVASSTPSATGSGTLCSIDSGSFTSACGLTFATSGFIVDVPDFLSAKGETATISAVKEGDAGEQCVPAFANVNKTVSLWSDYVLPTSGGEPVSVNSTAIGTSSGAATTQTLSFDASGQATPPLNYIDAGTMRLNVQYTGSGADAGLVMTGSGEFIARPAGMCVYPQGSSACASPYNNCTVYRKAGEGFNLQVTAVAWESDGDSDFCLDNSATPNYSANDIPLTATLISPSGGRAGTFTPTDYDHAIGGMNSVVSFESEVGVFTFSATPPLYQGAALGSVSSTSTVTYTSQATGRFIPDHFEISQVTAGTLVGTCPSGNLYSGETTTWGTAPEFRFTAHNVGHGITENYTQAGYQKLTASDITSELITPTTDGSTTGTDALLLPITYAPQAATLTVSSAGMMDYEFNALDEITYLRSATSEVNAFNPDLDFSFPSTVTEFISDSDGVRSTSDLAFTPDGSGVSVRFGRLWVEDSYGTETEDLIVPLRAEYFGDGGYLVNNLDSCTNWDAADASVDTRSAVLPSSGQLTSGTTGNEGILLQAPDDVPGTPDTGEAILTFDAPAWLEGDYDNDGSFEDPTGTATFGINRGHERLIYRKEVR